jgi:protein O-mannosyl-transferase
MVSINWSVNRGRKRWRLPISREAAVCLGLLLLTLLPYWQVVGHGFVAFDDDVYITENPRVRKGLSAQTFLWALTATEAANWHPLTWISHLVDVSLFGTWAGGHHLVNLLIHGANGLLLFLALRRMTGSIWESSLVAALFAIHPLHVESVAHLAQRKDVLSGLFWMLTLLAYGQHVSRPSRIRYASIVVCLGLGLMAKPILVTLPFVLLLLDFWPLRRMENFTGSGAGEPPGLSPSALIREKIPLFFLVIISCVITYFAQASGGAVRSLDAYPLDVRLGNAVVSYLAYLGKMLWPSKLAFFYPHPGLPPMGTIALSALLIGGASWGAIRLRRGHPYLLTGWLWYIGTLVPVIGLVQVGQQSMADRYVYIPMIGIYLIISWGLSEFVRKWDLPKIIRVLLVTVVLSMLMGKTYLQAGYWSGSVPLFQHAISVTEANRVAHMNLGRVYQTQGRFGEAIRHYRQALEIDHEYARAHNNLGTVYEEMGQLDRAIREYRAALEIDPDLIKAHVNMGIVLEKRGQLDEAIRHYKAAVRLAPEYAQARQYLGLALYRRNRTAAAIVHLRENVRLAPNNPSGHNNLAVVLYGAGSIGMAVHHLEQALKFDPNNDDARRNLAKIRETHSPASGTNETDPPPASP